MKDLINKFSCFGVVTRILKISPKSKSISISLSFRDSLVSSISAIKE
jgi:hypothetical protein